mmetsp:Transcript_88812/g.176554  ORF Transcript_88812/g.176554 Transcript_88812/m.176554 type:complete len:240 (+) Transcript_88812:53-772(+)
MMLSRPHDEDEDTGADKYAPSVFQYGRPGPKHWSLPEALMDSDVSASPPQSKSAEDIVRMRKELIQMRLQQTSANNSREVGCEATTNDERSSGSDAHDVDLIDLAIQTSVSLKELEQLKKDGILEKVPRNTNGELTSVGSVKHMEAYCKPCLFWLQLGCKKGLICEYCHMEEHRDEKRKSIRPAKSTRDRIKKKRDQASLLLEMHTNRAASASSQVQQQQESSSCSGQLARRSGKLVQL